MLCASTSYTCVYLFQNFCDFNYWMSENIHSYCLESSVTLQQLTFVFLTSWIAFLLFHITVDIFPQAYQPGHTLVMTSYSVKECLPFKIGHDVPSGSAMSKTIGSCQEKVTVW